MTPWNIYKYKLWWKLMCFPKSKKKLLDAFQVRLDDFLEDNPSPTFAMLVEAFGSPEDMAAMLTADMGAKEQAAYRRFSKALQILADVAVVALVLVTLYVLLNPLAIRIVDVAEWSSYTYYSH